MTGIFKPTATKAWMVAIGFLLASEAYFAYKKQPLLSDVIWNIEGTAPIVPAALGFCLAHFVWQSGRFMKEVEKANL